MTREEKIELIRQMTEVVYLAMMDSCEVITYKNTVWTLSQALGDVPPEITAADICTLRAEAGERLIDSLIMNAEESGLSEGELKIRIEEYRNMRPSVVMRQRFAVENEKLDTICRMRDAYRNDLTRLAWRKGFKVQCHEISIRISTLDTVISTLNK